MSPQTERGVRRAGSRRIVACVLAGIALVAPAGTWALGGDPWHLHRRSVELPSAISRPVSSPVASLVGSRHPPNPDVRGPFDEATDVDRARGLTLGPATVRRTA